MCSLGNIQVYLGNRRFLPTNDCLRRGCHSFPGKCVEQRVSPTTVYVANANADYVSAGTVKEKKALTQETGCKGSYSLEALPKHDRFLSTPVEPMHLLKHCRTLCQFITCMEDSLKVRRFVSMCPGLVMRTNLKVFLLRHFVFKP